MKPTFWQKFKHNLKGHKWSNLQMTDACSVCGLVYGDYVYLLKLSNDDDWPDPVTPPSNERISSHR